MKVAMPLDARCFLISLSVPYQLKPLVECPMRGRCTLASWRRMKNRQMNSIEHREEEEDLYLSNSEEICIIIA